MLTTNTMTIELATMIVRRKPQSEREWATMGEALRTLAAAGVDLDTIERDAMRPLGYREVALYAGE
jgi:hypothetical protein